MDEQGVSRPNISSVKVLGREEPKNVTGNSQVM